MSVSQEFSELVIQPCFTIGDFAYNLATVRNLSMLEMSTLISYSDRMMEQLGTHS